MTITVPDSTADRKREAKIKGQRFEQMPHKRWLSLKIATLGEGTDLIPVKWPLCSIFCEVFSELVSEPHKKISQNTSQHMPHFKPQTILHPVYPPLPLVARLGCGWNLVI